MIIFRIAINNEKTITVDTKNYDELFNYDDLENTEITIYESFEYVPQQFGKHVNNQCNLSDLISFIAIYKNFKEDLEEYYDDITYQNEIPFLYDILDFSDPEEFFKEYFESPYDAVLSVQYGDVHWSDNYIYFNGYGNLETLYEIPYDDYKNEIIAQWLQENF